MALKLAQGMENVQLIELLLAQMHNPNLVVAKLNISRRWEAQEGGHN